MTHSRPPQQERSRATLERILAATNELVSESGVAPLTIAAVAARAKVAVGSIYTKFSNKQELLAAAYDKWIEQGSAEVDAERTLCLGGACEFDAFVDAHVIAVTRLFQRHARLIRGFALSDVERGCASQLQQKANRAFLALTEPVIFHPLRPATATDSAIALVRLTIQATLEWRVLNTSDAQDVIEMEWSTLADQLSKMLRGYLGPP